MKKSVFLNNYKSYAYTNNYMQLKKYVNDTIEYVKNNNVIELEKISINNDFLQFFSDGFEQVAKDTKIIEKWQKLSNTKKRLLISKNIIFSLKKDFYFDRTSSNFNKIAKCYTNKVYNKDIKIKVNDLFYNVVIDLVGDVFSIDAE